MQFILLNLILTFSTERVDTVNRVSTSSDSARIKDAWFSEDKLHHFSYSFGITGLAYHTYHCSLNNPAPEARVFSISLASIAGIGKELYDRYYKKTKISYKDLTMDALGITLATLLFTF